MKPIKSIDRDNTGEQYWKCPSCGGRVGGYVITGSGGNDWSYERNQFCRNCGQKIDWECEV